MSKFKAFTENLGNSRAAGFQVTFDNGVTVSIMFGYGNYCSARNNGYNPETGSETAELAIIGPNGKWLTSELLPDSGDDVKGWVRANEIPGIMKKAANWKELDAFHKFQRDHSSDWSGASVSISNPDSDYGPEIGRTT